MTSSWAPGDEENFTGIADQEDMLPPQFKEIVTYFITTLKTRKLGASNLPTERSQARVKILS